MGRAACDEQQPQ